MQPPSISVEHLCSGKILNDFKGQLFRLGESKRADLVIYDKDIGTYIPAERYVRLLAHKWLKSNPTPRVIENIFQLVHLTAPGRSPDDFDNDRNIRVFANGTLMVKEQKLVEFSHEHYCRTRIPYDYDPGATCPLFEIFLSQVLAPEFHKLIKEILGCVLIGDNRYEKVLLLLGAGSNGKSVLLKVIGELVGKENISNIPLKDLAEEINIAKAVEPVPWKNGTRVHQASTYS